MWHLRGNHSNGCKEVSAKDYAIYCVKSLCNLHPQILLHLGTKLV